MVSGESLPSSGQARGLSESYMGMGSNNDFDFSLMPDQYTSRVYPLMRARSLGTPVPVARTTFGMSEGDNNTSIYFVTEHDAKWISVECAVAAFAKCRWKLVRIRNDFFNCLVHGGSKSDCCTDTSFCVPVERLVEISSSTTEVLNCSCHDQSAPMPHLEFGTTGQS